MSTNMYYSRGTINFQMMLGDQTILFASYRIQQAVKHYNDGKRQWTEST